MNLRFRQIAAISALLIAGFYAVRPHATGSYNAIDFGIFYCAGAAVDEGKNPYLLEPLRSCERSVWPSDYLRGYAEPAALPGYGIVPFALLALLPFGLAKLIWLACSSLALGIAVAAGTRLSRLPPIAVFALLAVPVGVLSIRVGQLGPFIACTLFLSAAFARDGRPRAAAIAALLSAIEPHTAIAALAALAFLVPASRVTIAVGAAILTAAHFAILGTATGVVYFTQQLPAMGRAEAAAGDQFGSIWMLAQFGLPQRAAEAFAYVLFFVTLAVSIAIAGRLSAATQDGAYVVALPVALSIVTNPYLHDVQLCAALVMPLAAIGSARNRTAWVAAAAALAVPWFGGIHSISLAVEGVAGAAVFVFFALQPNALRAGAYALTIAAACISAIIVMRHLPVILSAPELTPVLTHPLLAAESWGAHLAATPTLQERGPRVVAAKLITWAILLAVACWAFVETRVTMRRPALTTVESPQH